MGIVRKGFKAMFDRDKWRVLRGDKVMLMAGKDKGQIGTVLKVIRDNKFPRVVVEGLNLVSLQFIAQIIDKNNSAVIPPLLLTSLSFPTTHSSLQSKRHIKRTKDSPGGIISVESPLHYSNVQLVDPVTNAPVRVSWRYLEDGTKIRVSRGRQGSGSIIPRPDILKQRRKPLPVAAGPLDTPAKAALTSTHTPGDLPSALSQLMQRRQYSSIAQTVASRGAVFSGLVSSAVGSRLRPLFRSFAASAL